MEDYRLTDKRYARDNRLITLKSILTGLIGTSMSAYHIWGCRRSQGLGCSPIKVVRELGLERRETVWFLSIANVKKLKSLALVRKDWAN